MAGIRRAALLVAVLGAGALAGCGGGGGDVSRDSMRDRVVDYLVEPEGDVRPALSPAEAETVGTCVANAVFDDSVDDPFTRDERNEMVSGGDGDEPNAELAARVDEIVDDCLAEAEAES
jgi:hypothetical protein